MKHIRLYFLICGIALCIFINPHKIVDAKRNIVPVGMKVNGHYLKTDVGAYLEEGVTMIPIRAFAESLECDGVYWNDETKTVTVTKGNNEAHITVYNNYAVINGKTVKMQRFAEIVDGRTVVPLRIVSEALGADVKWDGLLYNVEVFDENVNVHESLIDYDMSDDNILWLARIIEAESGGEPEAGQIAVGNVILNRVKSKNYPNTIYGVIFDKKHGVQFQPVINGTIYNTPSKMCIISAKKALSGENHAGDSLFFLNPKTAQSLWIVNNRKFYTTIKNHDFYL